MVLLNSGTQKFAGDSEAFNGVVRGLQEKALRDLKSFGASKIMFQLDLDMRYGMQPNETRVRSPRIFLNSEEDFEAVYQAFVDTYAHLYGPASHYPQGGVEILNFCLWATIPSTALETPTFEPEGTDPKSALKGQRQAYWVEYGEYRETPVYSREELRCGNVVTGPALIEAVDTTYVINPGWRFTIDQYLNGVIEQI